MEPMPAAFEAMSDILKVMMSPDVSRKRNNAQPSSAVSPFICSSYTSRQEYFTQSWSNSSAYDRQPDGGQPRRALGELGEDPERVQLTELAVTVMRPITESS